MTQRQAEMRGMRMGHHTIGTSIFISEGLSRLKVSTVRYSPFTSAMTTPRIRCYGCDRTFTHCGLSQHISKTQDIRCRRVSAMSQDPVPSTSISHPTSPPLFYLLFELLSDPPCASYVSGVDDPAIQPSDGAFAPRGLQHMLWTYVYFHSKNNNLMHVLQI